ncbi:MAG: transposase, partial [Selenomonadaceae bacterium]|nr:transposase [Selenomonadaceae bacterium]
NATQIRKHKTDAIDSMIIADFIRYGNLQETQLASEEILELRDLTRFRNYQVSSISDLKRKTICILDQVFPEYEKIFSDVFGKTSKEILMTFDSVTDFADISTDKLEKILENITLKGFAKKKLKVISKAAKTSFGITYGLQSLIFQLRQLIAQINFIEQQVKQLEKKISALLKTLNSPITTSWSFNNSRSYVRISCFRA